MENPPITLNNLSDFIMDGSGLQDVPGEFGRGNPKEQRKNAVTPLTEPSKGATLIYQMQGREANSHHPVLERGRLVQVLPGGKGGVPELREGNVPPVSAVTGSSVPLGGNSGGTTDFFKFALGFGLGRFFFAGEVRRFDGTAPGTGRRGFEKHSPCPS
jgi:hypothetical protein